MNFLNFIRVHTKRQKPTTIYGSFRSFAFVAGILGLFPAKHISKPRDGNNEGTLEFRKFSLRTLYSFLMYLLTLALVLPLVPEYISRTIGISKMRATDGFAFGCFISSYFLTRSISFGISLLKTKALLQVLASFKKYDDRYGLCKQIILIDFHFWLLFIGSVLNIVGNYQVSKPVFQKIVESGDQMYWVSFFISDHSIASNIVYIGHIICEASIVFYLTTLTFFIRGIQARLQDLEREILDYFGDDVKDDGISGVVINFGNNWASFSRKFSKQKGFFVKKIVSEGPDRLKTLVQVSKEFQDFSGEFLLVFISLALFSLVSAMYVIIIFMSTACDNPEMETKSWQGIFALSMAVLFTSGRVALLINIGEYMQNLGEDFSSSMALIDTRRLETFEETSMIKDIRRISSNYKFSITACGFFVLNRKLIISMIGSIITFIVVLAQFRSTDNSP